MLEKQDNACQSSMINVDKPLRHCRVISVTAGKGGVGKSSVSVNLALALNRCHKKVLLLDADLSLSNIDVLLGISTRKNLSEVVRSEKTLRDIIIEGPEGIQLIPSSSGQSLMTNLSKKEYAGIITAFQDLSNENDFLLVDTAAGISEGVTSFLNATSEIICVISDDPTSMTDSYALIKLMSREYNVKRFYILVNMVNSVSQGRQVFEKLRSVTDKFLDVHIELLDVIENDSFLKKSVCRQKPVVQLYPGAKSSIAFKRIAEKLSRRSLANDVSGKTTFFLEGILSSD